MVKFIKIDKDVRFFYTPGKQPNGPGQFMFGSVVWEEATVWVSDIAQDLTQEEENVEPVVPREPRQGNGHNIKSTENGTAGRSGSENCNNNNIATNGNRRRSERKAKQNEPASIVDVIDKNGGRRKSIMV